MDRKSLFLVFRRPKAFRSTLTVLGLIGAASAAGLAAVPARADPAKEVHRVTLPVDQKLVDVSWQCADKQPCRPWYLMRVMNSRDVTRSYTFSGGDTTIIVTETREGGAWSTAEGPRVVLPIEQKLVGVRWLCRSGLKCEPWYLTRIFTDRESEGGYTFTDGETSYLILEDRGE